MVELLNLVPKQTVLVLNLVLLAIAARVMTWIDTKISRSRVQNVRARIHASIVSVDLETNV